MDAFTGEIRLFPFNFAPVDWAVCDGRLLLVNEYQALYSVIANIYGGSNGINFNLPDLRGRVAIGEGQAPTLSMRTLGQKLGGDKTILKPENFAPHTHQVLAQDGSDNATALDLADNTAYLAQPRGIRLYNANVQATGGPTLHPNTVAPAGMDSAKAESQRYAMQPFLTLRYCICLNGEYPQRW
ncbi:MULTISPECIES: tail fiber protein [Pseudomonas]|uniref:phage tail protein n=1 Tax=Pseudomonas TaxID=286 RepID=UPI000641E4FB|nr:MULTISPECIES: tail fiber protein [Pseudomonas]